MTEKFVLRKFPWVSSTRIPEKVEIDADLFNDRLNGLERQIRKLFAKHQENIEWQKEKEMNFVDKRKLHDRITYLEKAVESMRRRQDQTLREMTQKLEMMGDILTMMSDTGTKPKRKSRRKGWKMPPWKGPPRYCDECKGPIPNERAHNAKYCSKECADERHLRLLKEEYARNKRTAKGVGGSAGSLFSGLDN